MTSLTTRGRVAVVVGFVLSAGLAAGAAVALVQAGDRTTTSVLPSVHPTLIYPSTSPTPEPSATAVPTATATAVPTRSAAPSATPSRAATSASPKPPRTTTHRPAGTPAPVPPAVDAEITPVVGQAGVMRLTVHATSRDGALTLTSVDWRDGTVDRRTPGTACSAPAGGDCEDYALTHTYTKNGTYDITVVVSNAAGPTTVVLHTTITSVA